MKATTTKKKAQALSKAALPQSATELVPVIPSTGYSAASGLMAIIDAASRNPRVNVDKMERLLSMQMTIMAKQAEMAYGAAMGRLQNKLPRITKKGRIKFTDKNGEQRDTPYARYEDIDLIIRPLMFSEGFIMDFDTKWGADGATIYCTISHEGGHTKTSEMRLPLDTSGSKNSLQAMGSTISYGQRYLVKMMLNLIFEGEDADGSTFPKQPEEGDNFASRMSGDKGVIDNVTDVTPVKITITELKAKADGLKKQLTGTKRKRDRITIINDNLQVLRDLDTAGMAAVVADLHATVDMGA